MKDSLRNVRFDAAPRSRLPVLAPAERIAGLAFDSKPTHLQRFLVEANAGGVDITMFGEVGCPDGITPARVATALNQCAPSQPVTVKLNSGGGDYFDGVAIYNLLRAHSGPITTQILGLAGSAASMIAIAADRVEMAKNAEFMIHRAAVLAMGNSDVMQRAAATLKKIDSDAAAAYAAHTGRSTSEMLGMMAKETWMNSQEAIAEGFAHAELPVDSIGRPTLKAPGAPQSKRQLEEALRDMGYARAAASKMANAAYSSLDRGAGEELQSLIDRITAATSTLERKNHA